MSFMRQSLAQRLYAQVLATHPQPRDAAQARILLSRLPRNRLEARRLVATKGRVARVG
nr:hypothetical protein [Roseomonas sp. SXEYE001]